MRCICGGFFVVIVVQGDNCQKCSREPTKSLKEVLACVESFLQPSWRGSQVDEWLRNLDMHCPAAHLRSFWSCQEISWNLLSEASEAVRNLELE